MQSLVLYTPSITSTSNPTIIPKELNIMRRRTHNLHFHAISIFASSLPCIPQFAGV